MSINKPALAVALHYDADEHQAPRVLATGSGEVAEQILAAAREHRIPLQHDAPLAAALSELELGSEIPHDLYVAVAQVLAFAWSVSGRR